VIAAASPSPRLIKRCGRGSPDPCLGRQLGALCFPAPRTNDLRNTAIGTRIAGPRYLYMPRIIYAQNENTSGAIATYAIVFASICSLLVFGFYALMQPNRMPNEGLLAYEPPPATIITNPAGAALSDVTRAISPPAATDPVSNQPLGTLSEETSAVVQAAGPRDLAAIAAVPSVKAAMAAAPPVKEQPAATKRALRKPAVTHVAVRNHRQTSGGIPYPGYAALQ